MKKIVSLALVGASAVAANHAYALSVTTTSSASTLANTILGSGITASNLTYVGGAGASGTFTGGLASGIGIDSGIILTTGSAAGAVGPNNSDSFSVTTGTGSDAMLGSIASPTFDKTILEFDFTTAGGDLYFNYVFASEEYTEYANSTYNDVFAFFLDGTNIALIPGTSTPVTINNVNNVDYPQYFNNNDPSFGTPPFNIQYDGFTDLFTAYALGLSAGTHHIKLAIADVGDSSWDSAVFIQAGSFSDTPTPVPVPGTLALLGLGAAGLVAARRRK